MPPQLPRTARLTFALAITAAVVLPAPASAARSSCGAMTVHRPNFAVRVEAIRASELTCRSARRVIRRFYADVKGNPQITVGPYECGKTGARTYCADIDVSVSWRQGEVI